MTKLYVANTTMQAKRIHYRLPEQARGTQSKYCDIAPLSQRLVLDSGKDDINHVIYQLEHYGARSHKNASKDSYANPLVYCEDKPVDVDRIGQTYEKNQYAIDEIAKEARKKSVAKTAGDADTFKVTIKEITPPGTAQKFAGDEITSGLNRQK